MMGGLSRRERLLILVVAVGAVVLLGWELVVQPVRDRYRAAAELVPARERILMRRQELIARKPALQSELEATNARLVKLSERFLTSATPAVAASELQKIAKEMAAAAQMEVRSERILAPVERGELLEIPIEIAVSGEVRHLVELLSRVEQAEKLVTVQDLKVRLINLSQPKDLLATLTLSGFVFPAKPRA